MANRIRLFLSGALIIFGAFFMAVAPSTAYASFPPSGVQCTSGYVAVGDVSTMACSREEACAKAGHSGSPHQGGSGAWYCDDSYPPVGVAGPYDNVYVGGSCGVGGVKSGFTGQQNGSCGCVSGFDEVGGACVPQVCPEGQSRDGTGVCVVKSCPAGQALDMGNNCAAKCPTGQIRNTMGFCQFIDTNVKVDLGNCVDGALAGTWQVQQDKPSLGAKYVCSNVNNSTCLLTGESDFCGTGSDGKSYCSFTAHQTGKACTPDPNADPSVDPSKNGGKTADGTNDKTKVGKCSGTVNGVEVWVDCGSTVTGTTKEDTNVKPDGTAGDGVKVTEKIECRNDTCVKTTTTATTVNGTTTYNSNVTSGSKSAVCAGSTAAGCTGNSDGKDSSFGGSCQAGFTCDGDAATCAIAKAANESKCRLFDLTDSTDNATLALGQAMANGTDTSVKDPKTAAGGMLTVAMSKLQDVVNPYGDTCPANVPFIVQGRSFVIPLGDNCNFLRNLGAALWASTIFVTTVFVLKGNS